jgi:REP element-mobilizing transposase RayT
VYSRKRLRLRGFDYGSDGLYLVTVCTHGRRCLLGSVHGETMIVNTLGELVERQLIDLPIRMDAVAVDSYVVMPNHVHAIVGLSSRARQASPLRLGHVVAAFKSGSAREINRARARPYVPVWQRGYHDHVIRNDSDLERVREYIGTNPIRWALDAENPSRVP